MYMKHFKCLKRCLEMLSGVIGYLFTDNVGSIMQGKGYLCVRLEVITADFHKTYSPAKYALDCRLRCTRIL